MPPVLQKAARTVAWLLVAATLFLTLAPRQFRPITGIEHDLEHFTALALVGLSFGLGYPGRFWRKALSAIVLAAVVETIQHWIPHRHGTLNDFVVNASGLCAGLALAFLLVWALRRKRVEASR